MAEVKFNPRWRYHKTLGARLIKSQAELDALGPEWLDSPASFHPKPQKPAKAEKPQVEEKVAPVAPSAADSKKALKGKK